MSTLPTEIRVRLRRALERTLREGHPWVYRDALDSHDARPGATVAVLDRRGRFVGRGLADTGPIAVRLWTTRDEPLDGTLVARRMRRAASLRDTVVPADTDAYRLVHGEGDRMPGVVVDVYGRDAVVRFDGDGAAARLEDLLASSLETTLRDRGIETLLLRSGRGAERRVEPLFGAPPEGLVAVREHGMALEADLLEGQKTGLFLDHRESRHRVRTIARGLRVLNLYGYTGGFSIAAGLGGARDVTTVDVARAALSMAESGWANNGLAPEAHHVIADDVPTHLARTAAEHGLFEMIVADPPSFAPNEAAVPAAVESYEKLHAACLALLAPGGLYLAASCSSHVDRTAFEGTLRTGAQRARRIVQVLDRWGAPPDHPRLLAFPEGDYLKVVLLRALD